MVVVETWIWMRGLLMRSGRPLNHTSTSLGITGDYWGVDLEFGFGLDVLDTLGFACNLASYEMR
jgi:hypothetical protein